MALNVLLVRQKYYNRKAERINDYSCLLWETDAPPEHCLICEDDPADMLLKRHTQHSC